MSTNVTVMEGGRQRDAVPVSRAASAELLELLGFDVTLRRDDARSALGDGLAAIIEALRITPEHHVYTCAEVVEGEGTDLRRGDVLAHGDVEEVAAVLHNARSPMVVVVADADDPKASMADRLRKSIQGGPIIGVLSIGEAAESVLGLRARALEGGLIPAERRARARQVLFERTLTMSRLGWDWGLVGALAIGLARHLQEDEGRARFELDLVRDISRRHTGVTALIGWPDDAELAAYSPEVRLRILAHVVQSAADGDAVAAPHLAARARRAVGDDRRPEALMLLGAAGRALAAAGEYGTAEEVLRCALDGWIAIAPAGASHALCELLRIAGLEGDLPKVRALRERADATVLPALDVESRVYVHLAIGRAFVQSGQAAEGLNALQLVGGNAPRHVQTAAHRWRAVASRNMGDLTRAADSLARLERFGPSDQQLLARLDEESVDAAAAKHLLDALLALPGDGDEARRLIGRLAPGLSTQAIAERPDVLRLVRAEYRY